MMIKKFVGIIVFFMVSLLVNAVEVEVGLQDSEFTKKSLTIKAGDSVKFTNRDPFFYNVFSLSELKTFDLGAYPKGQSKSVKFDKQGIYIIECAIHSDMQLKLKVE